MHITYSVRLIITLVFFIVPASYIFAQSDGSAPAPADSAITESSEASEAQSRAVATSSSAVPKALETGNTAATPRDSITEPPPQSSGVVPGPDSLPDIPEQTEEIETDLAIEKDADKNNNMNFSMLAVFGVIAVFIGGYVIARSMFKNKNVKNEKDDKKDNERCKNIKSLLEHKKKELEDMVREWPEKKLKETAKDKVLTELKKDETAEKILETVDSVKEKYDKLKKAIEMLEKSYDLCVKGLGLDTGKNVYIIHGCPSNAERAMSVEARTYDKHWIPWIKKELNDRGIRAETPLMPDPWEPDYEKYKKEFEKYDVSENSVLVGHSCGSAFLVRWLGETKKKIRALILVAPWKIPDADDEARKAFYSYRIDETIKSRVAKIIMFTADNEEYGGKESLEIFRQALGGEVIELKGHGHYTMEDMGTEKLPELLQIILKS